MTMYLAAPALVAIVGCVLVSEKSDLWGLVVDSANSMAHRASADADVLFGVWASAYERVPRIAERGDPPRGDDERAHGARREAA